MANFLTTSATTYLIEELIRNAEQRVTLISPYLKFNARIRQLIEDRATSGICFDIVYGKKKLNEAEEQWLAGLAGLNLYFCKNLHAKCYLNEDHCVITSMNLYEFSQVNNSEMGVLLSRQADADAFRDATQEAQTILRMSERQNRAAEQSPTEEAPETGLLDRIARSVKETVKEQVSALNKPAEPVAPALAKPAVQPRKLTTSVLARQHKLRTSELLDQLKAAGYLYEDNNINKLTSQAVDEGAEFRRGPNGYYFLWPESITWQA